MTDRPRLVGINHVALEVGDLEEALAFYGSIFDLRLRGREPGMAFVDMGDQFIALSAGRSEPPDGISTVVTARRVRIEGMVSESVVPGMVCVIEF